MRVDQIRQRLWLAAAGIFLLSVAVAVADRVGLVRDLRPVLHDVLSPGRLMVLALSSPARSSATLSTPTAEGGTEPGETSAETMRMESRRREQQLRQLMIDNARLRRDLKREQASSALLQTIEPLRSLVQFDVIRATVISSGGVPGSLRDLLVDAGKSSGILRSELVIDGDGILVDAGTEASVAPGDRVLTGAVVAGRIEKAARWVSIVQPVTAPGFRAQVLLLRQTPDGLHPGATGILEGTGESECRLTGIPHTDAVAAGDEVISADINGVRGPQLYFGRVSRAEFLAGGQWDIRVSPAVVPGDLRTVGILRLKLLRTSEDLQSQTQEGRE